MAADTRPAEVRGATLFARYAYAPNALGYCGPPAAAALYGGSPAQVRAAATQFSGAWPYLRVLARMTGVADALDHRLVASYWLGGGAGAELDRREFGRQLIAEIGPRAGRYWTHLTPALVDEAAPNHCFHVLGVYPWSRLLGRGLDGPPLHVLDSCRISWGTVLRRDPAGADVRCRHLVTDGSSLQLGPPTTMRAEVSPDGHTAVPALDVGDEVALHWGRICDRLTTPQRHALEDCTRRQLDLTNRRLARVAP